MLHRFLLWIFYFYLGFECLLYKYLVQFVFYLLSFHIFFELVEKNIIIHFLFHNITLPTTRVDICQGISNIIIKAVNKFALEVAKAI